MEKMLSLDEARSIVLEHTPLLQTEEVNLLDACGRVAAKDLKADIDNAPFDHVAMDGYAMRAAQIENASSENPVELNVVAEIAAGDDFEGEFADDECVRIMTGAKIPDCADCCVKYEIVDVVSGEGKTGGRVSFNEPTKLGSNVRKRADEAHAGDVIVQKGEVINSGGVGFLAGNGIVNVSTYKKPRVALMATGSELVDASEVPTGAKIRNSNSYALAACVREAGGIPEILPIVKDEYETLRDAVYEAANNYDCVITTGGAANGDYDFIKQVVKELGEAYVTLVNMRPGKAQTFGIVHDTPVIGLPGNPAAAYVGFQMLIRPSLRKMQGYSHFERMKVQAKLAHDISVKKDKRMTLARAIMTKDESGSYIVEQLKNQSSGLFGPLQKGNTLIVIPKGDVAHTKGDLVDCIMLDINEESVL